MRRLIANVLPTSYKNVLRKKILGVDVETYFYSQCGEDAILKSIFTYLTPKEKGYYIDIGAYHPTKDSNTHLLYRLGWQGINIDPNPFSIDLFNKKRPGDRNLLLGIARQQSTMDYYVIGKDSTMNSFSRENLERNGMLNEIKEIRKIPVYPLSYITEKYLDKAQQVDFLNIDAEGFEMEILETNDWGKVKPVVIAVEQNNILTFEDVNNSSVCQYLKGKNYVPVAKNVIVRNVGTVIYLLQS